MKTKYTISLMATVAVLTPLVFSDFITSKEQQILPTRSIATDLKPDPVCLEAAQKKGFDPSNCEPAVEEVKEDEVKEDEVKADEVKEEVKAQDDEVEEYADEDSSKNNGRVNELHEIVCKQNKQIDLLSSSITTLQNNMQQSFMMLMMSQMFAQNNSQPSYERSFQGNFNQTGFLQGLMYGQQIMSLSNIMNPYQYSGLMGGIQSPQNIYNVSGDYYGSYNHSQNNTLPMPFMSNQAAQSSPYSFQFGEKTNSSSAIQWIDSNNSGTNNELSTQVSM